MKQEADAQIIYDIHLHASISRKPLDTSEAFPDAFSAHFSGYNQSFDIMFVKPTVDIQNINIDNNASRNVYVIDEETNQPKQVQLKGRKV